MRICVVLCATVAGMVTTSVCSGSINLKLGFYGFMEDTGEEVSLIIGSYEGHELELECDNEDCRRYSLMVDTDNYMNNDDGSRSHLRLPGSARMEVTVADHDWFESYPGFSGDAVYGTLDGQLQAQQFDTDGNMVNDTRGPLEFSISAGCREWIDGQELNDVPSLDTPSPHWYRWVTEDGEEVRELLMMISSIARYL